MSDSDGSIHQQTGPCAGEGINTVRLLETFDTRMRHYEKKGDFDVCDEFARTLEQSNLLYYQSRALSVTAMRAGPRAVPQATRAVEILEQLRSEGKDIPEAALEDARKRLRIVADLLELGIKLVLAGPDSDYAASEDDAADDDAEEDDAEEDDAEADDAEEDAEEDNEEEQSEAK